VWDYYFLVGGISLKIVCFPDEKIFPYIHCYQTRNVAHTKALLKEFHEKLVKTFHMDGVF